MFITGPSSMQMHTLKLKKKPHQIDCHLQIYVTATFLLYRSAIQTVAYPKSYENVFLNALTSSANFL